jgi:DtxR family transcriptional regulator, manganese transport regulator
VIVIRNRHGLLFEFFKLIGVTEQTAANKNTEGFKHNLHPESIYKVEKLVSIRENPSLECWVIRLEDIKRIEENN